MKIGVGVISYQRPEHLDFWREQILKYSPKDIGLSIYLDEPARKGIAYGKNQNLKDLKDCDFVFLFDSDCFPIKEGWIDFFIKAHKETGNHHFLYLKNTPSIKSIYSETICFDNEVKTTFKDGCVTIDSYNNCGGAFMFLTKKVIEKVGGFNPAYGTYGYEHAGYSRRIHQAGLTKAGQYLSVRGSSEYIYAMDYDFNLPFNKKLSHEPSLKNELHLLSDYLKKNKAVYDMDTEIYQPL